MMDFRGMEQGNVIKILIKFSKIYRKLFNFFNTNGGIISIASLNPSPLIVAFALHGHVYVHIKNKSIIKIGGAL